LGVWMQCRGNQFLIETGFIRFCRINKIDTQFDSTTQKVLTSFPIGIGSEIAGLSC
jgi:hypothetical protein